jgi:hypothetical protein
MKFCLKFVVLIILYLPVVSVGQSMSVSIYYEAARDIPLTSSEQSVVRDIVKSYSVDSDIEKYLSTGSGLNWESFSFYEKLDGEAVILQGSTKLPNNSEDATWVGLQHWCKLLSELRRRLPNAKWAVRVEDHEIYWDSVSNEYDPAR